MQDYKSFLQTNPNGVLATATDNQPHTRIFQYLWSEDDRAFFCTGASKDVCKELQANAKVSFCAWNPKTFEMVRLNGTIHFMDDAQRKAKVLAENPHIRGIYKDAANPEFTLFYVQVAEVGSFSMSKGMQNTTL